jgi:hypothetical protein
MADQLETERPWAVGNNPERQEIHEKHRIAGAPTEIRTEHLPNTTVEWYR